ncbi:MAG TPA: C40 family peptidase [Bacteroidota bacterium]|nr:C40 family peptidase [Bacteroidota bacterium]
MPKTLLDEARLKFAPDHRTAVFDVTGAVSGNTLTLKGDVQDSVMKGQLLRFVRAKTSYTVADSLVALPDRSVGEKVFGVVDVSVANLRTHPDHPAEMASQAILGTPVRFLKKERGWSLVQTPDEYLAWTDDRIARMTPEGYATWAGRPKLIVTAEVAWVRASKAKSAQPVSDVVAGAILASLGVEGGWWNVEYPDGRRGFLPRDEAEALDAWLAGAHDTPDRIIATARRFFGVPYLWGGTSSKGMDCSGFAKTVYYLNGVLLPRDADQQAQVGDPVEIPKGKLNLEPGDLLFFGKHASADSAAKVTHVAISLGGARFIHSSVDVHVNSLDPSDSDFSDFRAISFLGARRIIGAGESSGVRRLATIPYYHANEH